MIYEKYDRWDSERHKETTVYDTWEGGLFSKDHKEVAEANDQL